MKLHQPGLLSGGIRGSASGWATTPGSNTDDKRPVETIRSVISSIYSSVLNTKQTELGLPNDGMAASGAFAIYYASLLLISHGADVLQDGEWLQKVETFVSALARFSMRWKIAGESLYIWCRNWSADGFGVYRAICRLHQHRSLRKYDIDR